MAHILDAHEDTRNYGLRASVRFGIARGGIQHDSFGRRGTISVRVNLCISIFILFGAFETEKAGYYYGLSLFSLHLYPSGSRFSVSSPLV
ncbi:hypothetical protein BOTBODRAFT_179335 [Botryobasidium botryosum FD-172 SS1]|uniref:Uncharacterized protein n=1 Tax=Botryobasidium botryosum (strain FD-172 SS1) TaxID=930990 RepID=A0A067M2Q2_BOTB1|nr:hypothetical protein BOTBODRAFT_179335 [Botryobasidium botryosum FD-172 SS1]